MTHEIPINETAAAGAWSFNTQKWTENVYIKQIIVKATTATTTFHFYITDRDGVLIFDTRTTDGPGITGALRRVVNIPLVGIHTIGVVSSSKNEAFTGKLMVSERVGG